MPQLLIKIKLIPL